MITFDAIMVIGFILAAYAVVANDSVQTLGTFIASNRDVKWQYLWAGASLVLIFTLGISWYTNSGDISHGRLESIPFKPIEWYHLIAPILLLLLTRAGIPVSTSFLVLSTFTTSLVLEKIIVKSIVGYCLSFVFAYLLWVAVSKALITLKMNKKDKSKPELGWRVLQWASTGLLWYMWLSHDVSNIAVFLPRELSLTGLVLVLLTFIGFLAFMFKERGGKIQEIVTQKTHTSYVKSAILIDLIYAFILFFFKNYNNIPMSTTWVFVGLLAGRELAIHNVSGKKIKQIWPILSKDFLKMMFGLAISIVLALGISSL